MSIFAHKHSPMLRRIRILIGLLRNHLPQPRLLGEPLARETPDRMPSDLHETRLSVENRFRLGDYIWLMTQTSGPLDG